MELLDVVNEKDEVIGTATREECHADPKLIHHTIHFTLFDKKNNKILITQRSFKKSHDGGKYCFLGEHVMAGESYEEALKRGVKEELGFEPDNFVYLGQNLFSYDKQTEIVRFYVAMWNGNALEWDKNEMEQIMWLDLGELKNTSLDVSEMTLYWINNLNWNLIQI